MDEEVITISSSSTSSSGRSNADLIETDDVISKDLLGGDVNISGSSVHNTGSITTEPLRDSDAACDWEIFETWTILGEPVMRPIVIEPLLPPQAEEPEAHVSLVAQTQPSQPNQIQEQIVKPPVKKESISLVSGNFDNMIIDDDVKCVVSGSCTVQKAANILSGNNTLVMPTNAGNRSDCDTPSDGISIISDCSDVVHHQRHRPLSIEISAQINNLDELPRDFDTPPNTPGSELSAPIFKLPTGLAVRDSSEKFSIESRTSRSFDVVSPANIILFSLLAGITGIVLGNAFRVRPDEDSSILNHISPLVLRIQDLERENSDLKLQLKKLKSSAGGSVATGSQGVEMIFPQPLEFYLEQNINENGKRVWTGDQDNEQPITLENTKQKMPEFCSEDKSDDLFSERFQKICDEKIRKLSKTVQESLKPQKQEQKINSQQNIHNNNNNNNCEATSTCSGCQSCQSSSTAKQSDVEANFADDDESSVDRVKGEREKSPHIKRKIKRQKPVKGDDSDSSSETTVINNEQEKANFLCKKGVTCTGIFDKRKSGKKYSPHEGKENQKMKKANDDWNEKRKMGRDEMRRSNGGGAASSGTDDWFTKRASNREKQRGNGLDKKK